MFYYLSKFLTIEYFENYNVTILRHDKSKAPLVFGTQIPVK